MSLMSKLTRFARSPQGRKMTKQAMDYAKSPDGQAQDRAGPQAARVTREGTAALMRRPNLDTSVSGCATLGAGWTP